VIAVDVAASAVVDAVVAVIVDAAAAEAGGLRVDAVEAVAAASRA